MDLMEHQRKLLRMIKGTYHASKEDESYLHQVAESKNLELVREIATWWRIYDLERYCTLTTRLLKQGGKYEASVDRYVKTHALSPFINELSESFLLDMGGSEDVLLSEVALFELALTRVKRGDSATYTLDWQHNPAEVLACLVKDIPYHATEAAGSFRVSVSASLPGMFAITPL